MNKGGESMKEGWKIVKLKNICDKASSNVAQKDLENNNGEYPIHGASGLIKKVDFFHYDKRYIGIVKDGSGVGRVNIYPANSSLLGTLQYILPKTGYELGFVYYALQSLNLSKYKVGAAIPHIYFRDYGEKELSVPPLEEQHRIVGILDASFKKIDALKKNAEENLKNAKALFQQVLAQELKPKEGWVEKKLGEVGDFKNGMNFAHNESGTEIHMLGVGDFGDLFFINDVEKLPILSLNKLPSEDYLLKDEDIVFVRSNGNKQLVGRSLVVYPKGVLTTFSGFCIRFRKRIDDINIIFLTYYLKTKDTRKKLFGNGANISNLNQKMLQDLLFVYPSLEEQHRIVRILDALSEKCRRLEEVAQQTIRECDALKQSILRKAFSGEL